MDALKKISTAFNAVLSYLKQFIAEILAAAGINKDGENT